VRYCLDTTFLDALCKGDPGVGAMLDAWRDSDVQLLTTEMNYFELRIGIERLKDRREREICRERLEKALMVVGVFPFERAAADLAVKRQVELYKKGRPAASTDLFIAAAAKAGGCSAIVTRNVTDFERIGLLKVVAH